MFVSVRTNCLKMALSANLSLSSITPSLVDNGKTSRSCESGDAFPARNSRLNKTNCVINPAKDMMLLYMYMILVSEQVIHAAYFQYQTLTVKFVG